jgi:hypothetical protein
MLLPLGTFLVGGKDHGTHAFGGFVNPRLCLDVVTIRRFAVLVGIRTQFSILGHEFW